VAAASSKQAYSREDVRRVLHITERQLRSWEKQELIPTRELFGFSELLAMKTLLKLRREKILPATIRKAVTALRSKVRNVENPLTELRIYVEGSKVRVDVDGGTMEMSGQLLLNFDREELKKLLAFPGKKEESEHGAARRRKAEAELLFEKGLEMEQTGAPIEEVIEVYKYAVMLDPQSTGALVNLGTIFFNARDMTQAEGYYRRAISADPEYALAHFNLGNLYDETGRRSMALHHYEEALKLNPRYADAHYNLALLFQTTGETLKAVRHWKTYLKIDPNSSWAAIARRELAKIRESMMVVDRGSA
jgi:tetratricopeptide (TPR) repeat protein